MFVLTSPLDRGSDNAHKGDSGAVVAPAEPERLASMFSVTVTHEISAAGNSLIAVIALNGKRIASIRAKSDFMLWQRVWSKIEARL
jgi:hypothetical protein